MGLKHRIGLAAFATAALAILGLPNPDAGRKAWFAGNAPVLPMRFAHSDHVGQPCAACHHEFVDRRDGPSCMSCHVTDPSVAPMLEQQFHRLCQSCHLAGLEAGESSGPVRHCRSCHRTDQAF